MIDYYGFVQGFAVLFIVVPLGLGATAGVIWAWQTGRRGGGLILPALASGVVLTLIVFAVAILLFRA